MNCFRVVYRDKEYASHLHNRQHYVMARNEKQAIFILKLKEQDAEVISVEEVLTEVLFKESML